jgi:hypothetical protein
MLLDLRRERLGDSAPFLLRPAEADATVIVTGHGPATIVNDL